MIKLFRYSCLLNNGEEMLFVSDSWIFTKKDFKIIKDTGKNEKK